MNGFYFPSNLRFILLVFCCLSIGILGCSLTGILSPESQPTSEQSSGVEISESPEGLLPVPTDTQVMQALPTSTPISIPAVTETNQEPTPLPDIPPEIASQMDEIELQLIELRELQPIGFVSRSLLTREQLRHKIENEFFEDYTEEEARVDSIVQSAFGLLQSGFNMFNFYKDFLNEQIAGLYDRDTKVMDIVQGSEFGGTERLTYAHEYTHALQDQNYDIENGLEFNDESCEEDSERCAAVQALIEGDASFSEYMWFSNYATMQDVQDIQEFFSNNESPIYDSAPDFLKEDFLFPYIFGQTFVGHLYDLGGWEAVNKAYNNPPVSTEQILHPERYPADRPVQIDLPDLSSVVLGEGWRELDQGILGEWYTFLVLAHGLVPEARLSETEAQSASDGWGGDVYVVYYNEQEDQVVLVLHTSWETISDANQFFNAFQAHSTSRFGSPSIIRQDYIGWNHDEGYTEIHKQDRFTTWILSPDQNLAQTVWELINGK
jgi:hypothetical protein